MDILKSILFGIVEGITEWLPVSSTGHMILLEEFVKFKNVSPDFFKMFEVVIQLGAILAVVLLYFKDIWPITNNPKRAYAKKGFWSHIDKPIMILWYKILLACVPAAVVGLALDDFLDKYLYNSYVVGTMLILFGIAFIVIENHNKNLKPVTLKASQITYKQALIIGIFQLIAAIFPGTSRSGATIIGALMIGVSRKAAADFTFYLAIPVMFGASLLKIVKFGFHFTGMEIAVLLTGMIVAFLVSVFVIKLLLDYIRKHDFKVFGWYRIVLGIIVWLYFGLIH
ncbi:MAG: undecaprenyl-diphosphate phosphatase [Lachnospiraceae bacterium]|nr:undecaprenyl-diphosphate phosphatase [Lachnospiraceae bacterium]